MNNNFKFKLVSYLTAKKANKGFTLIELLVVVIIIGVLAAVALPNLLGQVGKARETEGKTAIGSINRAQQAYHFEKTRFSSAITDGQLATNSDTNNVLGITVVSQYYTFNVAAGNATGTTSTASGENVQSNGIRSFGGAVAFDTGTGTYSNIVCQTAAITATAPTMTGVSCPGGSDALK